MSPWSGSYKTTASKAPTPKMPPETSAEAAPPVEVVVAPEEELLDLPVLETVSVWMPALGPVVTRALLSPTTIVVEGPTLAMKEVREEE